MGSRIPEFVTRTLASSVVGTVGVDTSKSRLFESISADAARVFNVSATALAQRKQTIDSVDADARTREYEAKVEKGIAAIQTQFASDPNAGLREAEVQANQLLNDTLSGIPTSRVKSLVSTKISGINRVLRTGMKKWVRDQDIRNTGNNFTKVDNIEAGALRTDPSVENWVASMARHELRTADANKIYSPTQSKTAMDRGGESRTKGLLNGFMADSPAEGARLLATGIFDEFLPQGAIEQYRKDFKSAVKGAVKEQEYQNQIDAFANIDGLETMTRNKELTVDAIDAAKNEAEEAGRMTPALSRYLETARKIATENVDLTSVDVQDIVLRLNDNLRELNVEDKKTTNANLEDIADFMAKVNGEFTDGNITDKTRTRLLDNVTTPFNRKIQQEEGGKGFVGIVSFGYFGAPSSPYDAGYLKTNDWLDDRNFSDGVKSKAKFNILDGMLREISKFKEDGIIITNDFVENIVDREIQKEVFRQNPKLRNLPPEGKPYRLTNGQKVLAKPDGTITPIN